MRVRSFVAVVQAGKALMKMRYLFAIVVGIAVAASGCSSTSDDAADQSSEPAVVVVMSALDAKNSGDLDGWLSAHPGGQSGDTPIFAEIRAMSQVKPKQVTRLSSVCSRTSTISGLSVG
jgi:hypothetical protein